LNSQRSFETARESGTLYMVGTPIGNLEDMTYRAVRVLQEADLIAAEDTRQTRKLLTHFDIKGRLVAYHEHNKRNSGPELVRLMLEGKNIALVSDAGLPGISDPGSDLVKLAVEQGVPVVPVPGASASLTALIASGLPTERFLFAGFLPRDKKSIGRELDKLRHAEETLIFYESPHRIVKTLEHIAERWSGERGVCLARELTKRHEEFIRGTVLECLEYLREHPPLGEFCVIVEGAPPGSAGSARPGMPLMAAAAFGNESMDEDDSFAAAAAANGPWWSALSLSAHVAAYMEQAGDKKEAMKLAAADRGVSKRDVYNALLQEERDRSE